MISQAVSTGSNGVMQSTAKPDAAEMERVERRARRFWVGLIVTFLGVQVIIGGFSVYVAVGGSDAVIPNYHQAALDWDIKHRSVQLLDKLGWNVEVAVSPINAGKRSLQVVIHGKGASRIEQQSVLAKVYHHAHGKEIVKVVLREQSPGIYENSIDLLQPGLWHIELAIEGDHGIASKTLNIEVE